MIENRTYVLTNLYIPPPSKTEILYTLMELVLEKPRVPVIVMGDFNTVMDWKVDRFLSGIQTDTIVDDRLSLFLGEAILMDIWRLQILEAGSIHASLEHAPNL